MPWVDRILCLECGNVIEPVNGVLPEGPCIPDPEGAHEGQCAVVMAKVFEPELVPGGGLFGRPRQSPSQGPA